MKKRTKARQLASAFLYQQEIQCGKIELKNLPEFIDSSTSSTEIAQYVKKLVRGYIRHRKNIDNKISQVLKNWTLARMYSMDRNIIRIGAYELLYCTDVHPAVVINEAVILAKKFGFKKSGKFVNGVLDAINKKFVSQDGDKITS